MTQLDVIKIYLMELTGLERDALHIYVALTVFLGSCLIFKWKTRQWKPWLLVLFAALLGEIWDIQGSLGRSEPLIWSGNWHDVWNTMVAPTVLMILTRFSTIFGASTSRPVPEPTVPEGEDLSDQP